MHVLAQSEWPDWQTWVWLKWIISISFTFAFGACAGSFLNVVVIDFRRHERVSPPSRCPSCGGCLKWYQNLPVVAGSCSEVGQSVDVDLPTGPLVELLR